MKRYIIILMSLFLSFGLYAETKNITLTFNENDFILHEDANGVSITSNINPLYYSNDTCLPALPIIPVSIHIENSQKIDSYSYSFTDTLIGNNITIKSNQPPITTNGDSVYSYIDSNSKNDIYPDELIKYTGTSIIDGYKIISFGVCPFRYDTMNKELFFLKNIHLELILNTGINSTFNHTSKRMNSVVRTIVENKENINITPLPTINYDYLIITNNLLRECFQKLANWKNIKGVRTKVITIEEIDSLYSENSLQDKIKKAVKNYYNGDYKGLKYVLLGGDETIVPTHLTNIGINPNNKATCASDVFYACLDNLGWNNNTNVGYDNVDDNIDIVADVIVSRLCVNTVYSANVQINRIINYESKPDTTDWEDKILMTGAFTEINSFEAGESTYNQYIKPYWQCSRTRFYDSYTDFSGCENYDLNVDNLINELKKGYTFVNLDFHGDTTSLSLENGIQFHYYDVNLIENKKNSIIITSACLTNNFAILPHCLSESFMRKKEGGILAYIGSSKNGFIDSSFYFNRFLYQYLLSSENQRLGEAYFYAKSIFSQMWNKNNNERNTYRYLYYSINFLGDPEMPIYFSKPKIFDEVKITYNDGSLSIETGVDKCKICISCADNNQIYRISENTRTIQLSNLTDSYYICITKPGYIPYVAQIGSEIFIQNKTITDDQNFYSTSTFIGNNVTNKQEQGDVIIESGKTTITHTQGVHITKGFSVKNGAELVITNNL